MQEKKFKYLVADTTAFINNVQLQDCAEHVFTVPDVVNEVKNRRQIRRLVVLPFDLEVREPNTESLKYVTEFAKKTGDYTSLSAIDLKVIALTYELEKQYVGVEHLRTEPVVRKVIASKNKPEEFLDKTPLIGFYIPKTSSKHDSGFVQNWSDCEDDEEDVCDAEDECDERDEDSSEDEGEEELCVVKNADENLVKTFENMDIIKEVAKFGDIVQESEMKLEDNRSHNIAKLEQKSQNDNFSLEDSREQTQKPDELQNTNEKHETTPTCEGKIQEFKQEVHKSNQETHEGSSECINETPLVQVVEHTSEIDQFDDKSEDQDEDLEWITSNSGRKRNTAMNDEIDDSLIDAVLVPQKDKEKQESAVQSVSDDEDASEDDDGDDDGDDDDSSWITPGNITEAKKQFKGEADEDKSVIVACMSTDYAIQNVLKQMNLNVAALNGRVIKQLRTYILRCYACFKTTSIMTKSFCPYCGNKTLKRVAVSLDENGQQVIHINLRRPLTSKYKNQSLPRPHGGKHSNNPILVEDQPLPKQMPSRVAKTKTNALDEDYSAGYSPFVMRDVDSKSALLRTKGNVKQWARNNMYEENRRKKHSSRLLK